MSTLPELATVCDVRQGIDPVLDAWLHHFRTENNIEHLLNPTLIATPEQLRFMVALDEDQVYFPCSDDVFRMLVQPENPSELLREYARAWRFIVRMIRAHGFDKFNERRVIHFSRLRFQLALKSGIIMPSRLVKRLDSIVLTQCGIPDPYRDSKLTANRRAVESLHSTEAHKALQACPADLPSVCSDIRDFRWELDMIELKRLLYLSTMSELWKGRDLADVDFAAELNKPCGDCNRLRLTFGPEEEARKKVLYLPDVSGGIIYDLKIIKALLRMGHQVVLVLKEGFHFKTPTMWDAEYDPVLAEHLEGAMFVHDEAISKNDLLATLREHRFVVISDGTREQLNLYRTSVTFARAWKECDVIMAKGRRNHEVLIGSSHIYTRDILCFHRDKNGEFHFAAKEKSAGVRKFSEADILSKSDAIIRTMREAKQEGKTVIFYSCVIGSIPGQTDTAISVVHTFVSHLRERMEQVFVINPAEHFSEGMDGDDLMFMWERVQRSGLIDVWRFQTVEDIETSFALMGRKVPPVWSGKDSTYSTGCTKEMHIAIDVQKKHPELQIIGPSSDKFFRRREYGVGKFFDAGIK
ncbi:ARMT1-like domain-containing protein [Oleidesulfovibrio sp.]|uniref:ARMT1-like domain-containing protein n=1 Tax=Oleidesulfovibrio sp. TaxID=2909707 RepID=UPI003A8BBE7C